MTYTRKLPFYTPQLARERRSFSGSALREAAGVLTDNDVKKLMRAGQLALALIRPSIAPADNRLGLKDDKAAAEIESRFSNLGIAAKFSFRFDRQGIDEFYVGPRKDMLDVEPIRPSLGFANRWDEMADLMVSGPTTLLLLYAEHNAPHIVRKQFGHWNIEKNRDPQTIRGQLGTGNYNNLTHGSDTPDAVLREASIVAACLRRTA